MHRSTSLFLKSLVLAVVVLLPQASGAVTCQERFDQYNTSSWWWGALGAQKLNPGGSMDPEQIFGQAFMLMNYTDRQDFCFRTMLRNSSITNQGIAQVILFNTPPTCTQRFNTWNSSSYWWGALGAQKQNPGGSIDPEQIFGQAFSLLNYADRQDFCFRTMLRNSAITNQGIAQVIAFNTPPTCDQRFAYYDNSYFWWVALGTAKQNPGGSIDPNSIFATAWMQMPAPDYSSFCLQQKMRTSLQTANGIAAVIAFNTPPTCEQRFANYETSAWWWGALGAQKQQYPGGSLDPEQIFGQAFMLVPYSDRQDFCFRTMLRNSSITNQGIAEVIAFNSPPTCDQLFTKYDGSSFWQGALQNCDVSFGPTTQQGVLDCAFVQVPVLERTQCLKNRLAVTSQTTMAMLVVITHNTSVANNRSVISFLTPETCPGLTDAGVPAEYFSTAIPAALTDTSPAPAPRLTSAGHIGTHEGRLIPELRVAARLADPRGCSLVVAATLFAQGKEIERATAFADLAVTGRQSFKNFEANLPDGEFCKSLDVRATPAKPCPQVGQAPSQEELVLGCHRALERSYRVANFLRTGQAVQAPSPWYSAGGTLTTAAQAEFTRKQDERTSLGWIAVSGEDDQPHRPVNVPSSPSPQYELDVDVATPSIGLGATARVHARFVVAQSRAAPPSSRQLRGEYVLQPNYSLSIAPGSEVILFVHGMDSRAEESEVITRELFKLMSNSPKNLVIISVDLPTSGYSTNLDYDFVSPLSHIGSQCWPFNPFLGWVQPDFCATGMTPQLDFIETFIVRFAETLHATHPFLSGVKAVMGGSLGGNMSFRLGRNTNTLWLPATVVWSPASIWNSLGEGADPFAHAGPYAAFGRANDRLAGDPDDLTPGRLGHRQDFFDGAFDAPVTPGFIPGSQPMMWTSNAYPCKYSDIVGARLDRQETYNPHFRAWHWRLAAEQLLFSHQTIDPVTNQKRFKANFKRMLLACGGEDNVPFNGICNATQATAPFMTTTPGKGLFLNDTGHSIDHERREFFAAQVSSFLQLP